MNKVAMRKLILSIVTAILFVPIPVFAVRPDWAPAWFAATFLGATISVWLTAFAMLAMVVITRVEVAGPKDERQYQPTSH